MSGPVKARLGAAALAAAVLAGAAGADAAGGANTAPAGPQLTLGTLWGPDFWQALRDRNPMAVTRGGNAVLAVGNAYTDNPTVEELSPQGAVLWSTALFGRVANIFAVDGGRMIALAGSPMAGAAWGPEGLYLFDPATRTLTQAGDLPGGAMAAGANVLTMGGWVTGAGYAAVYGLGGQLLSSTLAGASSQVVATATTPLLLLPLPPAGARTEVETVNAVTGALQTLATWDRPAPTSVVAAGTGVLLAITQGPNGVGADLGAWRIRHGTVRRLWTWGYGHAVGDAQGNPSLVVTPSGSEFAVSAGAQVLIADTVTGAVLARLAAPGYGLDAVGALPDGFVVHETPDMAGDGVPLPGRLATFDLAGRPVDVAVLPAGENPSNEVFTARTVSARGLDLVATTGADDVVAVVPASGGAPLGPQADGAPLTLGLAPPAVASLAVTADGQAVTTRHPLIVTPAMAGRPVTLRLLGLDAQGSPVAAPVFVRYTLSDGGHGGTFPQGSTSILEPGQPDTVFTYTNAAPGRYVITATITSEGVVGPQFRLPKAVPAGAAFTVTVTGAAVHAGERLVLTPVPHSDVASAVGVTATAGADGTYTATFTAGSATGAAALRAVVVPGGHALGESAMVNVGNIGPPQVTVANAAGATSLTIRPALTGDRPIGFVLTQGGTSRRLVPYGSRPCVVQVAPSGPIAVQAVDADGALSVAVNVRPVAGA